MSGDKRVHSRVCVVTCNGGDLFIISKRARTVRRHQCHEHVTCACIYVCVFVTGGKKLRFERAFSARARRISCLVRTMSFTVTANARIAAAPRALAVKVRKVDCIRARGALETPRRDIHAERAHDDDRIQPPTDDENFGLTLT